MTPKDAMLTPFSTTGHERRAHHWYFVRGLLRPRPGPEPSCREEIDALHRGEVWNERNVVEYPVEQARLFANIERAKKQRAVRESCFLALAVVKTLGGVGKSLYLTHASIYLPLYKDLCRQYSALVFLDWFLELIATGEFESLQVTRSTELGDLGSIRLGSTSASGNIEATRLRA
jgi:hypothetical protein